MIRIFAYRTGDTKVVELPETELKVALADADLRLWIDVEGRDTESEECLIELMGLHPLVVEDIFNDATLPKIEEFEDYVYVIVHGLDRRAESTDELNTLELDIVLAKNWVLTHRNGSMRSVDAVEAELRRSPRLFQRGSAYVAHSLLDHLTDHYMPLMDRFDEDIDGLETKILEDPTPKQLEHIFALKRSLQRVRRVSVYQKEILHRLSRGEFELIDEEALPFFRDVYDHFVRVADLTDSYRELVASGLEMYLSMQSQKLNEVMKTLTLISTIMLPLTFIAGVYGMNFKHMPELEWLYGYPFALFLMLFVTAGLVWHFKRRKWV